MSNTLIVWLMVTNTLAQSVYSICAPFLPREFELKGLSTGYAGLVFSIYSLGLIIVSPLVGKTVDRIGHKNIMSGGIGVMGLAYVCFGFIEIMTNRVNIMVISIVVRFMHG